MAGFIMLALTAGECLAQSVYTPYTFTTLAGSPGQNGSADGTRSAALFNYPTGVAIDSTGNLYVVENNYAGFRRVTSEGVVTTVPVGLNSPFGVAVDADTTVYVANSFDHTIVKVTAAGVRTELAGAPYNDGSADGTGGSAQFRYPYGVAVDRLGTVYVADTGNNTIRKVTPAGVVTTLAGLAQLDGGGNPIGGSADGTGSAARFNAPYSVAVDGPGNLYVADTANHTIRKITATGVVSTFAGLAGTSGSADGTGPEARFSSPNGVAVDSAGSVYVADTGNNTIRKVTSAGVVTTLAGSPLVVGNSDGTGMDAQFNGPSGVALDELGSLYVIDSSNHTIRKGSPTPAGVSLSLPGFDANSGAFGFLISGTTGSQVVVEASMDLAIWVPLWTNTLAGDLRFSDPHTGTSSRRFYRAFVLP